MTLMRRLGPFSALVFAYRQDATTEEAEHNRYKLVFEPGVQSQWTSMPELCAGSSTPLLLAVHDPIIETP
jgi:hypothetical protein